MNSIIEYVKEYSTSRRDVLCAADRNSSYTYGQIYEKVQRTASFLCTKITEPGEMIAIINSQNTDYIVVLLACQLIGVPYIPIDSKAGTEQVKSIIDITNVSVVISKDTEIECATVLTYSEIFEAIGNDNISVENKVFDIDYSGNELCEILFTTGTTGKSKGINISHINNVALAENIACGTCMKKDNVELIPMPLSHSHGLRTVYAALFNGSSFVITDGVMDLRTYYECIDKYNVSSLDLCPSMIKVLFMLSEKKLVSISDNIDYIEVGTAVLDSATKDKMCNIFKSSRLYDFYGSTESGRSVVFDFNNDERLEKCIGKPAVNADIVIMNDDNCIIDSSVDNMGRIAIAGKMNMLGYFKDDELTKSITSGKYIITNDIGYINDGRVFLFGRRDDVINCNGIKISAYEIEAVANVYKDVEESICIPQEDKISGQIPKLYVVVKNSYCREDFITYLKSKIEPAKVPGQIEITDSIPKSSNGKVLRKQFLESVKK